MMIYLPTASSQVAFLSIHSVYQLAVLTSHLCYGGKSLS